MLILCLSLLFLYESIWNESNSLWIYILCLQVIFKIGGKWHQPPKSPIFFSIIRLLFKQLSSKLRSKLLLNCCQGDRTKLKKTHLSTKDSTHAHEVPIYRLRFLGPAGYVLCFILLLNVKHCHFESKTYHLIVSRHFHFYPCLRSTVQDTVDRRYWSLQIVIELLIVNYFRFLPIVLNQQKMLGSSNSRFTI